MDKEKLIADIKAMTVAELNELVKALEEEFGVSAVVVGGSAGGDANASNANQVQTEFDVILKEVGSEKINVIKVVRALTGLGLKEAKDFVEAAPKAVKEAATKEECEKIAAALQEVGAVCEIK